MSSPQTENKCPKCKRVLTRRWIRKELNLFRLKCLVCKEDVLIVTDEDCPRCSQKLIKTLSFGHSSELCEDVWIANEIHCDLCGYEPPNKPHIRHWILTWLGFPACALVSLICALIWEYIGAELFGQNDFISFVFIIILIGGTALGITLLNRFLSKWL